MALNVARWKFRGIQNNVKEGYLFSPPRPQRLSTSATTDTFVPYYDYAVVFNGAAATKVETLPVAAAANAGAFAVMIDGSGTASSGNPINVVDTNSLALGSITIARGVLKLQCVQMSTTPTYAWVPSL